MLTFLHLSDLHFVTDHAGTQYDRDIEIRAAILDDLGKEGRTSFDAILVTGDVAYHGRADDGASLEKFGIPAKLKATPTEAANQYYRELVFLRALAELD
jgi:hypothetical protein